MTAIDIQAELDARPAPAFERWPIQRTFAVAIVLSLLLWIGPALALWSLLPSLF